MIKGDKGFVIIQNMNTLSIKYAQWSDNKDNLHAHTDRQLQSTKQKHLHNYCTIASVLLNIENAFKGTFEMYVLPSMPQCS